MANDQPIARELAESYFVRGDHGSWARVFILEGRRADGGYWGYLSIVSDFGNFGNGWTHMGCPLKQFLANLEFSYAMEKLRPREQRMQFDFDASMKRAIERVLRARRDREITDTAARRMYDAVREIREEEPIGSERFGYLLMDALDVFWGQWDAWEWCCVERYSPDCVGLWESIWPRLIAQFQSETETQVHG